MIRGTTASFKFELPHKLKYIRSAKVAFWQEGYEGVPSASSPLIIPYKPIPIGDPMGEKKELIVVLTPDQTMQFTDKAKLRVQMRAINDAYDDVKPASFGSRTELFNVYPIIGGINDDMFPEDLPTSGGYIILSGDVVNTDGAGVD